MNAWAAPPTLTSTCGSSDTPESSALNGEQCDGFCDWYASSSPIPANSIFCDASAICNGSEHLEAYAVEYGGNYVIVGRCKTGGGSTNATTCCVYTDQDDVVDNVGVKGTGEVDYMGLTYPIGLGGSAELTTTGAGAIDGWLFGEAAGDFLYGSTDDNSANIRSRLRGMGGADTIHCNDSACLAQGGDGDDKMFDDDQNAGSSPDVLEGNDGADLMICTGGDDTLWGGVGDDHMAGGLGADRMAGQEDDDLICGDRFSGTTYAGLTCSTDDDEVGDGDDDINGGLSSSPNDTVFAHGGDDEICNNNITSTNPDCGGGYDVLRCGGCGTYDADCDTTQTTCSFDTSGWSLP